MKKLTILLIVLCLFFTLAACSDSEKVDSPSLDRISVGVELIDAYPSISFEKPLFFTTAGDASGDCYVVQQTGKILVFEDSFDTDEVAVFLDLSDIVNTRGTEEGLLGLAFHPDYEQNGFFYVNYTTNTSTVVERYTRSNDNPLVADPQSGKIILTFEQPYANHNGGHLEFGEDGYLYIATGDGGSAGDPEKNAQNLTSLLGKILRIDIDNYDEQLAYSIPSDNPFVDNTEGIASEIYAYGLRNPWRFSFDSEGRLWVADVGQNKIEEINLVESGGNYGWNVMEGTQIYEDNNDVNKDEMIPPIFEYNHDSSDCITGGYMYESDVVPMLSGRYIYGDFGSGKIWALWFNDDGETVNQELLDTDYLIASFGLDADGDLRIVDLSGKIYRFQIAGE